MANAALALVGLAVVGGGLYFATKAKASEAPEDSTIHEVTGDSGALYHTEVVGSREVDGQSVVIVNVYTTAHELILVYQQFAGDQNSRIWDKLAGGFPADSPEWQTAVQDFGVFVSV